MRLKLYRLSNVFNPHFYMAYSIIFIVIILGAIFVNFRVDYIVSGIFVLIIYFFLLPILNAPKYIEFKDEQVYYITNTRLLGNSGFNFINVKVKYRITNINELALQQNKFERLFGVAHIVLQGETHIDAGKHTDKIEIPNIHHVYGISIKKHKQLILDFIGKNR